MACDGRAAAACALMAVAITCWDECILLGCGRTATHGAVFILFMPSFLVCAIGFVQQWNKLRLLLCDCQSDKPFFSCKAVSVVLHTLPCNGPSYRLLYMSTASAACVAQTAAYNLLYARLETVCKTTCVLVTRARSHLPAIICYAKRPILHVLRCARWPYAMPRNRGAVLCNQHVWVILTGILAVFTCCCP